jgi:molybdate/tungstate transport system substrate-binding protein
MRTLLLLIITILLSACNIKNNNDNHEKPIEKLSIFHAGSLSKPLKEISDSFQKLYPNIKILRESAGSLECIRKITDLNKDCDVLILSDFYLIEKLMYPNYAKWSLPFATNEIVIAFLPDNKKTTDINSNNWMDIMLSEKVRFARSDPNADPCGYRTLLLWKLAEKYYKKPQLFNKLSQKNLNFIRPKEVDLLALLESRSVDYIFIYRSVAIQHNLKFISLPDNINLGNPQYENEYNNVNVEVKGKKPDENVTINGQSILYGLTIPIKAKNNETAEKFVNFILFESKEILKRNGQSPVENIEKYVNNENSKILMNHSGAK